MLKRYADWLLSRGCPADKVIDLRTPLLELIRHERSQNTAYRYGDGIHPDTTGHRVIARTLLRELYGGEPELQIDKYFGAGL